MQNACYVIVLSFCERISNKGAILGHLFFDIASNIPLRTFLSGSHIANNVPIERNINMISNDT